MFSIIIPAYNEEKYIEKTLQSIEEQTCREYETIVVANGCTDNTVEKAKKANRILVIDKPHVSIARNIGAQHAQGDVLVFLDADTRLAPNALSEIRSQFKCAVATLPTYPNAPKFQYYLLNAMKNTLHGLRLYKGSSGVIITSAALFHEAKGFDKHTIRENSRFIKKLAQFGGYKLIEHTYAITSTRRYEKWGLLRTIIFWLIHGWKYNHVRYEAVR